MDYPLDFDLSGYAGNRFVGLFSVCHRFDSADFSCGCKSQKQTNGSRRLGRPFTRERLPAEFQGLGLADSNPGSSSPIDRAERPMIIIIFRRSSETPYQ